MPADTRSNDDWHWQVNAIADVDAADRGIRQGHYQHVSPGPVSLPGAVGLHVRDPDGHAVMLQHPTPSHE